MTQTPPGKTDRALPSTAWLQAEPLRHVLAALSDGNKETRVIGGAVRNALLGAPITEIDLATQHLPNDVMRLATAAGFGVYPTGLAHGTVTVVVDGTPFEITTLRRDVETDGRHAVVAFTSDWHDDAMRRDFTFNALSCDATGVIYDPIGGLADLDARRVRFIGAASDRIREDYLRILRFFRFMAEYGRGDADAEGLAACAALQSGLTQISAERIGAEMLKLVVAPRAGKILGAMHTAGILDMVFQGPSDPRRVLRLQAIEATLRERPDVIIRLAGLATEGPEDVPRITARLRLSNDQAGDLTASSTVNAAYDPKMPEAEAKAHLYRLGSDAFSRAARVAWARSGAPATDPARRDRSVLATRWSPPEMPVNGGDILAIGVPAGPRVGKILKAFETWWISAEFPGDGDVQMAKLLALAKSN